MRRKSTIHMLCLLALFSIWGGVRQVFPAERLPEGEGDVRVLMQAFEKRLQDEKARSSHFQRLLAQEERLTAELSADLKRIKAECK